MKYGFVTEYIGNTQMMKCHLCGKEIVKSQSTFRSHMRMHIRNGEISSNDELAMRIELGKKH